MQIVNGYPCLTCSDVAKAKRNIDPAETPLAAAARDARADPVSRSPQDGSRTTAPTAIDSIRGQRIDFFA